MRILVVGASGMVGSAVLSAVNENSDWEVFGSVRDESVKKFFPQDLAARIIGGLDLNDRDRVVQVFSEIRPDVIINCAGVIKHKSNGGSPLTSITLNSLVPHRLADICKLSGSRMIHVSTDCVFSGAKGGYTEKDPTDAGDAYGQSKALGELDYDHCVTLRTSFIGHELNTKYSLLEWFLSQEDQCLGFRKAIFSGLPTSVFAKVVRDYVIPNTQLTGLYHVSAEPINKYDLLNLIAAAYAKKIRIIPDDSLVIDRSLDSSLFSSATGYSAAGWPELIREMRNQPKL